MSYHFAGFYVIKVTEKEFIMKKIRIAALQGLYGKHLTGSTVEKNIFWSLVQIETLSTYGADVVCLSEVFSRAGLEPPIDEYAEPQDGPTLQKVCDTAKKNNIAIIAPIYESENGSYYNTAFFVEKDGSIAGKYRKLYLTEGELENGVIPGSEEQPLIEFAGMKAGCQICFDANFPQSWLNLKKAGAEIIFFCSVFSGEKLIESYSTILRIPIVVSTWPQDCRIYDRLGRQIAHQSPYYDFAIADVYLPQPVYHLDKQEAIVEQMRKDGICVNMLNGRGTWTLDKYSLEEIEQLTQKYGLVDVDSYLKDSEQKSNLRRRSV